MTVPVSRPTSAKRHRFKGLHRWAVVYVCAVVSLVALWLWWPYEVRRQVRAEIASLQARGEPVLPEDFHARPLPDDQNAALLYHQAMGRSALTTLQRDFINGLPSNGPLTPADQRIADGIIRANRKAVRLAREARGRPGAYWPGAALRTPVFDTAQANVGYDLARVLDLAAERAMGRGDHGEAVGYWRDLSHLASALRAITAVTVPDREDTRTMHWAVVQIERHAPRLLLSNAPGALVDGIRPANPEDLRALIRELLDDEPWHAAEVRVWQANRAAFIDAALQGWRQPDRRAPKSWHIFQRVLWPMERMETLRLARFAGETVGGVRDAPNFIAASLPAQAARKQNDYRSRLDRTVHEMSDGWSYGTAEYEKSTHYEDVADRHLAAAALAVRLYRHDYDTWPETLGELVPRYLPAVPSDPFAAGASIKTARSGGRRILYSVGENGIDDGGSTASPFTRSITPIGSDRWRCADGVMLLEPPPPAPRQPPDPSIELETGK